MVNQPVILRRYLFRPNIVQLNLDLAR